MSSLSELFNTLRKPLLPNQSLGLGSPKKHVKNLLQGAQVNTHKTQGRPTVMNTRISVTCFAGYFNNFVVYFDDP